MLHVTILGAIWSLTSAHAISTPRGQYDFPNPEPCTGNCTWIHDPSVIKQAGWYYRFSTSGNIAIATAPAMTGPWTYQGALLEGGSSIQVADDQDIWAPDVSLVGGTYYAYYAVSRMGLQNSTIGVATSTSLLPGTWTDHGSVDIPHSISYNQIDPNLFQDSLDGSFYLIFGSYWDDIFQTQWDGPPFGGTTQDAIMPINIVSNRTQNAAVTEGSFQFKWNNWYFLFFSVGWCCNEPPHLAASGEEYRVMVCRSDTVTGPFFDQDGRNCLTDSGGTLVLGSHGDVYAPGGQGVIYDEEMERTMIYYHYVKPSVGYAAEQFFFGYNFLDFSTGWPIVVSQFDGVQQ